MRLNANEISGIGSSDSKSRSVVTTTTAGTTGTANTEKTASPTRTGGATDAQVARWLQEYVRRRTAGGEAISGRRRLGDRGSDLPLAELKARIANHHTGLVESIARRFIASGEPLEDLVQEGFLGLLSALENYDTAKNVKFSTYATHFIAGAIRHCLRDRGKIIKEPAWLHEISTKINRTSESLTQTLGRPPHAAEIAEVLNLTEQSVEEVLSTRATFQVAAFDSTASDNDNDAVGLVDPEKIRSDKFVTLQLPIEDRIVLEHAVEKLKALEQKVLFEFFYKDLNQTEIARKCDISCNYVSHIIKNSTKKLRKIMGEAEVRDRGKSREASIIDPASGLYTAAHMMTRLDEELSRAARAGQATAVLIIDIDGLPAAGLRRDEVWAACGNIVRKSIRRVDVAGRYENNSLLVLLPQTGEKAGVAAERLLDILLAAGAASGERFTACLGSAHSPAQGRTSRELIALARDEAGMAPASGALPVAA